MTPRFCETLWMQRAALATSVGHHGYLEVGYLEERPTEHEGPFLVEERNLINSLADSLSSYLTRREAEEGLRETHAQLQALSRQLMYLQEQERQQLAHDLHDEVGQALTALKMNLQTMQLVANISPVQNSLLTVSVFWIPYLRECGISPWTCGRRCSTTWGWCQPSAGILSGKPSGPVSSAHVDADSLLQDLPGDMAVVCFRIVQEAVTNVLRHAKATQLDVVLRTNASGFDLIVKDNGVGFRAQSP